MQKKWRKLKYGASQALSNLRVPFLSCFMGGFDSGIDLRDTKRQGTKYNGSGCLIHGLTVVADCFIAIDSLLKERPDEAENLIPALKNNFEGYQSLHKFLLSCHKFGNNLEDVDDEAAEIAERIANIVSSKKNYLGKPFRPDFRACLPIFYMDIGFRQRPTEERQGKCWAMA